MRTNRAKVVRLAHMDRIDKLNRENISSWPNYIPLEPHGLHFRPEHGACLWQNSPEARRRFVCLFICLVFFPPLSEGISVHFVVPELPFCL